VETTVVTGGELGSRKGLNVPGTTLSVDAITPRDLEMLGWALDEGIDLIAQSFVRSPEDVTRLRGAMGKRRVPIVAKIEKHEAAQDIDGIVEVADAVMVARGDLGVELPPEDVPLVQRRIIAACRVAGKPVIVATQMLESMTSATRPSRAEASDVANAIFDAADAVMLSAETAIGAHPTLAFTTMERIARTAESAAVEQSWSPRRGPAGGVAGAVSAAVCELAEDLELAAIVTATQSGATARAVASHRPAVPIVAVTPVPAVARQLALVWGVVPALIGPYDTIDRMIELAGAAVLGLGIAKVGDLVAVTGGVAVHVPGSTNLMQVHRL
jgi:pyruvate kinase